MWKGSYNSPLSILCGSPEFHGILHCSCCIEKGRVHQGTEENPLYIIHSYSWKYGAEEKDTSLWTDPRKFDEVDTQEKKPDLLKERMGLWMSGKGTGIDYVPFEIKASREYGKMILEMVQNQPKLVGLDNFLWEQFGIRILCKQCINSRAENKDGITRLKDKQNVPQNTVVIRGRNLHALRNRSILRRWPIDVSDKSVLERIMVESWFYDDTPIQSISSLMYWYKHKDPHKPDIFEWYKAPLKNKDESNTSFIPVGLTRKMYPCALNDSDAGSSYVKGTNALGMGGWRLVNPKCGINLVPGSKFILPILPSVRTDLHEDIRKRKYEMYTYTVPRVVNWKYVDSVYNQDPSSMGGSVEYYFDSAVGLFNSQKLDSNYQRYDLAVFSEQKDGLYTLPKPHTYNKTEMYFKHPPSTLGPITQQYTYSSILNPPDEIVQKLHTEFSPFIQDAVFKIRLGNGSHAQYTRVKKEEKGEWKYYLMKDGALILLDNPYQINYFSLKGVNYYEDSFLWMVVGKNKEEGDKELLFWMENKNNPFLCNHKEIYGCISITEIQSEVAGLIYVFSSNNQICKVSTACSVILETVDEYIKEQRKEYELYKLGIPDGLMITPTNDTIHDSEENFNVQFSSFGGSFLYALVHHALKSYGSDEFDLQKSKQSAQYNFKKQWAQWRNVNKFPFSSKDIHQFEKEFEKGGDGEGFEEQIDINPFLIMIKYDFTKQIFGDEDMVDQVKNNIYDRLYTQSRKGYVNLYDFLSVASDWMMFSEWFEHRYRSNCKKEHEKYQQFPYSECGPDMTFIPSSQVLRMEGELYDVDPIKKFPGDHRQSLKTIFRWKFGFESGMEKESKGEEDTPTSYIYHLNESMLELECHDQRLIPESKMKEATSIHKFLSLKSQDKKQKISEILYTNKTREEIKEFWKQ